MPPNSIEGKHLAPPTEGLQRTISDVSYEVGRISKEIGLISIDEVERAECECCGLCEDYTPAYIGHVRDFHCGKWVCGLCSEAVKEQMHKSSREDIEHAVGTHMALCRSFKVNPSISLARSMREIVLRRMRAREAGGDPNGYFGPSRNGIARSRSCVPRIDILRDSYSREETNL
ncbi:hypothetical protein AMTRI_Chr05g57940 [Amborella trichopoda]